MKALIVEDEQNSALLLKKMIQEYCPEVECENLVYDLNTAIKEIENIKPDILFLDIMLKDKTGFDLLEQIQEPHPQIIFTTAFDQYALKAIRFAATDYLLKPISLVELKAAVNRAKQNLNRYGLQEYNKKVRDISNNMQNQQLTRISLPSIEGHIFVDLIDIIRFQADGSYTRVLFSNRKEMLLSRQLKEYDILLSPNGFVRAHHAHLINTKHVVKYVKGSGGHLVLSDGTTIEVAQRRREDVVRALALT
jgi:two-component system LytT family response regulator